MTDISQPGLFDISAIEQKKPEERFVNPELDDWALVYLVTRSGGNRGNLFILRKEDAQKLCEDECSHGSGNFGQWMFQWTSLTHFVTQNDTYDARLEDFVFIYDTGRQDQDFKRLGIQKPELNEMKELLESMGYQLVYKGQKSETRNYLSTAYMLDKEIGK